MPADELVGGWTAAFLQAQRDMPAIRKDKQVNVKTQRGTYSYSYATLDSIIEKVRKVLNKHGLAFAQSVESEDGNIAVTTRIYHSLGHVETFGPIVLPSGDDAQAAGSATTYARRYGLTAALGIAADEDNDASGAEPTRSQRSRQPASDPAVPQGRQANREEFSLPAQGAAETSAPDTERGAETSPEGRVDDAEAYGEGVDAAPKASGESTSGGPDSPTSEPGPSEPRHDLQDKAKRLYGGPASLLKAAREKYGEDILTGNHITDEQLTELIGAKA